MTLATDGSGPNGVSLEDSLNDRPPTAWAVTPGWDPGMSSRMRRSRGASLTRPVSHARPGAGSQLRAGSRPWAGSVQGLGRVRVGLGGQRGGHGGGGVGAHDGDRTDEVAGPVDHGPHVDAFRPGGFDVHRPRVLSQVTDGPLADRVDERLALHDRGVPGAVGRDLVL